jgi:uncharacterized protein YaaN involved in tellurite resistance
MENRIVVAPLFPEDGAIAVPESSAPGGDAGPLPTDEDINRLGAGDRQTYDAVTGKLLESHRTADLGAIGDKLNELITVARGLDYQQGRKGLVESALGFFRNERERIIAHMQTVQGRLDTLKAQVDGMVAAERDYIKTLGELKDANIAYFKQMRDATAQAEIWLASANAVLAAPVDATDSFAVPKRAALQQLAARLERAINDFKNATALAQQEALTIQMESNNAQVLLDEFDRAETLVLPALRSIVGQQLIQIDQQRAAKTDEMLRSTLDDALRAQAQLTGENAVELAKLQQGAAIRTTTLLECGNILDVAAAKVKQIQEAGRQARLADATNRTEIERRLLARFVN